MSVKQNTSRDRATYAHWAPVQIRLNDNDSYGHVNNAVHYQWFDTVVNQWLIERGLLDIAHGDVIGLVVETGCSFVASLTYPEPIEVGLAVARLGRTSVTYHLGVFASQAPTPAAQGHFTHVYVDRETRKPIALSDLWHRELAALKTPGPALSQHT